MDSFHNLRIRPWLIWGLAALFGLYTFLLQGVPSVMIPQLMKTYQIDEVKIGVLTSSFFYTYIIMQIPAGILVDLWGPRRIIKISFLFCAIAIGWFAFSHHFWEGQISRMIMGLTSAPAIICAFCLGSRWFKSAFFTMIVALTEFIALGGGVIGEGGLAKAVVAFGWRETVMGVAIVGLILTFLSLFIIHDFPDHDQPLHNGMNFSKTMKSTWKNFIKVIAIKPLWVNGIYAGFVFSIFPAFAALWGVPYFENRYHVPIDISAMVASTFFVGGCIGTLSLGWISIYITNRRPIMIWGTFIAFILSVSIIYVPTISLPMMFVLMLLFGFFCSTYALSFSLADTYVDQKIKGVAMGFTNMLCIAVGAPIMQPLIGYLLKRSSHDYTLALAILPLSLLIAFIMSFFVREGQGSARSLQEGH